MEVLAQPRDVMFQRNVLHMARKAAEVQVWVEGIPEPKVGFLAGLDEEYLQVCTWPKQALSNIRRDYIISIDETGKTLGWYIKEGADDLILQRIRDRIVNFKKRANGILEDARVLEESE